MRIISGQARGRKLLAPGQLKGIRPTSDRAREALFSIVGDRVAGARVLDLYAGTGALGLEALSRGASTVVFVDYHPKTIELIKKNLNTCMQSIAIADGTPPRILKHDLRRGIRIQADLDTSHRQRFDLIFLDPPYGKGLAEKTLQDIDASQLCAENSLIIAEEARGVTLPDSFPSLLQLTDQRRYGDTKFWFYTTKNSEEHGAAAT